MNINLSKLKMNSWFEDKDGNIYPNQPGINLTDDWYTYHVVEALTYTESMDSYTYHPEHLHEHNSFYQAMLHFKWFYNWMYKRMKKRGDAKTFKRICTPHTHIGRGNGDIIVAMVNQGDYTLDEAIYVWGTSCERCCNVLAYKYLDGKDGYAEYSDEWKKCNTVCEYCKDKGAEK